MSLSVCPASVINASLEKTWSLLYEPAKYGTWADAKVESIVPAGNAKAGQNIYLTSKSMGIKWKVSMYIIEVDVNNHRILLETHLPFKLMLKNTISCIPYDEKTCLVRYG